MDQPASKSWSIYTRREIISKYQILELVGSGAYSDVYKGRRLSDNLIVALKEIHDYQSAFREIEALQALQHCPNVVVLHEYFWSEDEDAVLVLEYLPVDLSDVIRAAKKGEWKDGGLRVEEIKRWMIQILSGVDACHRSSIVHRDLKPTNLLISADGVLKLADFGQARILLAPGYVAVGDNMPPNDLDSPEDAAEPGPPVTTGTLTYGDYGTPVKPRGSPGKQEFGAYSEDQQRDSLDEVDKEGNVPDGDASCLATYTASEMDEDPFRGYSCEAEEGENQGLGPLTSCVGTRWYRAPELLFGSTTYGTEIDLWALGCIFAELLSLEPMFPGTSDIDQISRVFSVLGNLTEEVWAGCLDLPDYKTLNFVKVVNPPGVEGGLPNRSTDEIQLVKKLLSFDPANRATAMELLQDKYLNEEPLPAPILELRVPSKHSDLDEDSPSEWGQYREFDSDSEFDDFGPMTVTQSDGGFSIQFS
ncbi:OLC1v1037342C1 [Oldenlandia corymbosa var. corymbosa]|uniref:cyclin-dependent kinase n=1 Tax=Oldenlandia corymbosa var. corymbosa TaxID=529605 RepID=A0AAV1D186_OLDCO|nr:OLC1v1037342C1 [Oldenlandia corymbosa var. corymbosa]